MTIARGTNGGEITHREALAAIAGDELVALKVTSDRAGLAQLAAHLGLLVLTSLAVLHAPGGFIVPALVGHGVVLVFLFSPLHECIHQTAFRSPWLNKFCAVLFGFIILLPPRGFTYFHMAHHRHTQDEKHDPELETPKPTTWGEYIYILTGVVYWREQLTSLVALSLGGPVPRYVPDTERARAALRNEARAYVAAYGFVAVLAVTFGWAWLIWLWIAPLLMGQPFLRAYLLAEHTDCPLVPDMLANSRTIFTNRLVRLLAWNMPYHTAHHALPVVPFHNLPALTERLRAHLKVTSEGYIDMHRQLQSRL